MNILNCDICGTSYPDTEEKCPTCGYSRAFDEETMNQPTVRAPHEHVRGGRYSKKNVEKRKKLLQQMEEAGTDEDAVTVKIEEPVQAPVVEDVPVAEEIREEAAPAVEESHEEAAPVVQEAPEEVPPVEEEPEAKKPAKVKKEKPPKEVRRRRRRLNFALILSVLVFIGSLGYLGVHFGLIDVQALSEWIPAEVTEFIDSCFETDVESTEPSADEEVTEAATEQISQTQSGSLGLNYTELTFNAADQAVQLYCEGYTGGEITWSSDNESVATVSGSGKVVSVGPGTTYIWAAYGEQSVKCVVSCKF